MMKKMKNGMSCSSPPSTSSSSISSTRISTNGSSNSKRRSNNNSSSSHFLHRRYFSSSSFAVSLFPLLLLLLIAVPFGNALKCLDCVGKDCMGNFCEGDYCLLSHYAPRWGTMVWGEPKVVKGCLSGRMLRRNVRAHCETADEGGDEEPFTCFCDGKDYCNRDKAMQRLEIEPVQLYTCICEGTHCREKTCLGELCTFVLNHRSKERERGCVNASVPLVERRSAGACMIPPITGAMHHTVAKRAEDLLSTESCVCEGDYCNSEKPEPKVPENAKCRAFVQVEVMGQKMVSRNKTCSGEFCFRAEIQSKLGHMSTYRTMGCASFVEGAQLAEELEPTGCAKFESEQVQVEACFQTKDKSAIERAEESWQGGGGRKKGKGNGGGKGGGRGRTKSKGKTKTVEEEEEEEEEEIGEEEMKEEKGEDGGSRRRELKDEEEEKEEREEEEGKEGGKQEQKQQHFIFERPTLAPAMEESSNTTLISVFLLLILLILLSGVVWKFQLHKRLSRANYDTVAGG